MFLNKKFEKNHFKGQYTVHAKIPKRVILWARVILWRPLYCTLGGVDLCLFLHFQQTYRVPLRTVVSLSKERKK
jgi:hypothetical protein